MSPKFSRLPPMQLLVAFEAVARLGGFGRAAGELRLSDSAISHRIRELERLLGVSLFERHTRVVELTLEGREFLGRIQEGLECLDDAVRATISSHERVRLSVLPSFARFWLLPRLTDFQRRHPDVTLEISSTTKCVDLVKGEADMAVRFGRPPVDAGVCEKLLDDEWFPVASPAYISKLGGGDFADIIGHAVLIEHKRQSWRPWFNVARIEMPDDRPRLLFSDTALMVDAALQCDGIALVRHSLVRDLIGQERLVRLSHISIPSHSAYYLLSTNSILRRRSHRAVFDWILHSTE